MTWNKQLGVWEGNKVPHDNIDIPDPLWIFGYASVCWKPTFPYVQKEKAILRGYVRRFWQLSTDHRGTPDSPGLVCTIISYNDLIKLKPNLKLSLKKEDCIIYGIAYKIDKSLVKVVLDDLDFREKGGYTKKVININIVSNNKNIKCLLYKGNINNPHFKMYNINKCSNIIFNSIGPSGTNIEYLFNLYNYLNNNSMSDNYINKLYYLVKKELDITKNIVSKL